MRRYIPILAWLPQYQRKWLQPDFIAGLTIMAILVPEGMAYAQLAGHASPGGLFYAAPIVGLVLYAIFGTSRQLVDSRLFGGCRNVLLPSWGGLVPADSAEFIAMSAALAILAGLVAVMAGLLRLGRIGTVLSPNRVLTGFISGLALVIMIKQVPKLFGLEPVVEGKFLGTGDRADSANSPRTDLLTLAVGLSSLVLMFFLRAPLQAHSSRADRPDLRASRMVSIFNLAAQGVDSYGRDPSRALAAAQAAGYRA